MAVVLTRKKTKPKAFLFHTAEELIDSLGGVPTNRVRIIPSPGRATEADVVNFWSPRINDDLNWCKER